MLAILRNNTSGLIYSICRKRGVAICNASRCTNWNRHYCVADKKIQVEHAAQVESLTKRQKLNKAIKEYGTTVLVFHVTISIISLGTFYLLVSSGIDIVSLLKQYGSLSEYLNDSKVIGASNFVIAYTIHKIFAPVRIGVTLSVTPIVVRYLRSKGFLTH